MTAMPMRPLADTGISLSMLGLGTVKLGRERGLKYPQPHSIPDDTQAMELLHCARDLGVNLLDTAPAYGTSEARLGGLLPRVGGDWVVCTKVGEYFDADSGTSRYDFGAGSMEGSVKTSLQRLRREVLDLVLLHSDGEDLQILQGGALDTLHQLRRQGLIRAIGISCKSVAGGMLALQQGADAIMLRYHRGADKGLPVIEAAAAQGRSILIKKALDSGHLACGDADLAAHFAFICRQPGVSSLVVGTANPAHLRANAGHIMRALL